MTRKSTSSKGVDFLRTVIKASKNEFASIAEDGVIYDNKGFIDTGNFLLNLQMSGDMFGGAPSNTCTCIAGQEGVGKTFMLLGLIKHFLDSNPEAVAILFESEGAIKSKTLQERGIDISRCSIHPVGTIEEFRFECNQAIDAYAKLDENSRFPLFIGLDSLGMLSDKKETEDAVSGTDKADMGGHARRIKATFRVIRQKLCKYNIPLFITNHLFADPGAYVPTFKISGGSGIKYAADSILILKKKKIKEGEESFSDGGIAVTCTADKMRETKPFTQIPFTINFNNGVTRYSGLFDFCLETSVIVREGMRYKFNPSLIPPAPDEKEVLFFKKEILAEPEKYFTPEKLSQINKCLKPLFVFGSSVERIATNSENEEDEEGNEKIDE